MLLYKLLPHLSTMEDESLKHTDFALIAAFLLSYDKNMTKNGRQDIEERMKRIHGESWASQATIQLQQIKNPKQPNIDEFS